MEKSHSKEIPGWDLFKSAFQIMSSRDKHHCMWPGSDLGSKWMESIAKGRY